MNKRGDRQNKEFWQLLSGKDIQRDTNFLDEIVLDKIVEDDFASAGYHKSKRRKLTDNPNPQAHIAFIMEAPFYYFVYKNIYKHIASESEFIIDYLALKKNTPDWFSVLERFTNFLKKRECIIPPSFIWFERFL